jgi:hypothetical protein
MSLYPDAVDLSRLGERKHWFTEAAKDASTAIGDEMVEKSLEYLREAVK